MNQLMQTAISWNATSDSKDQKRAFRRGASNYQLERGVLYYSKVVGRNPSLPERNWRRVITSTSERGRMMESCHAALQGKLQQQL